MNDCLELNIQDIEFSDDNDAIIYTNPEDLKETTDSLEKLNYKITSAQVDKIPSTEVTITDEAITSKLEKLLDLLDDNDDVQNVWHNWLF